MVDGDLADLSVAALFLAVSAERLRGRIVVAGETRSGMAFFEDGRMIHAECGPFVGELAALDLLGIRSGRFRILRQAHLPRATIHRAWTSLVAERLAMSEAIEEGGWSVDVPA